MGGASNRTNLRVQFSQRHVRETIVILEEGNRPYPRFPKCVMFMSHKAFNGRHLSTDFCRRGEERKRRRLAEEEAQAVKVRAITTYGNPLSPVTSFKYLGIFLSAADDDW